jgi:hypothetical protein
MFKIRMSPTQPQVRRFDVGSLPEHPPERSIFFKRRPDAESVETILMTPEPWFEQDTGRLEFLARVKLWRRLIGDQTYDADYWASRLENPARV